MNTLDAPRIGALARALDLSPRQLLVAMLQLADADARNDAGRRREAIAWIRAAPAASATIAALLLTPIASFAQDDIDHALANLWPRDIAAED